MAATKRPRALAGRGVTSPRRNRGFSMIEVLVSLIIIQVGLLGLVGTQVMAQRAESESYQRAQAIILLNDMVERINANRSFGSCFAFTDPVAGTPYLGVIDANHYTTACSGSAMAQQAMDGWDRELQGAAERNSSSNSKIGAMLNARGCISSFTDTSNVTAGVTVYVVAVVWQAQNDSFSPTAMAAANPSNTALQQAAACGAGLYGSDDGLRRVVWASVQIASLN
jgi:type IV pilus assembly protein PilV